MEKIILKNNEIEFEELEAKVKRKILSRGGSMMAVEVHFKKGGIGKKHSHDQHEQISYILAGEFEVEVGDEKKVLTRGDSFYAGKNVEHGVKALADSVILDVFTPQREDFLE
ncbi:quercetin dioxygenase-like cupin family protein [Halanaerobium saccharolyticum]|uniref:Quercetin dioxygenase-like cupin family protein n=1 Tax=Halanaerobium saccharolyticum TaxID=43595 RepID=A0A4R7Z381_9FIRM|nr:cupin domain-containing protein [Halanaerobium saccharolyticum]RAK07218.1 quercetin dioxygenase-like cupin family protein [Halanaerobium saccharolyticum]TDW02131.1 quercetin dioxygenase-like cupin family protein [Halanaerobium saccharolyticum]TDX58862.1 quercetin dioxygenase-like cupin family protein [Halanaerobium saccharolyticum]